MFYNMDWLRAGIDKIYIFLSGLSDYELCELLCILIITLAVWGFLPSLPGLVRYLKRKHKAKNVSQKTFAGVNPTTKVVVSSTDSTKTSLYSQKIKTILSPIPKADSTKPELDVEELKKILNMK